VALAFWVALAAAAMPCEARDLSLTEAEKLLAAHNRELRAARRGVESAEALQLIAAARPNPIFSINSSEINRNPGIGAGPLGQKHIDTVFRIDQPFERGDKRELRLDVASGLQKAAENDSLDVLRQQLAALRAAYFDLKQVQEKVVVLADTAQLFTGTLAAAQARLKAGDLAPADVAKVQVDYERAQNEARAVRAELVRTQFALGYLIGAEAGVDRYAALDALERARAVAGIELRRAASDLNAAAERLERYETSLLGAAGRSAQAAEFAFLRGATSVLEVLDARRTLRAVQLESVTARADYAKALAAWRASLSTAEQLSGR
jgi:cobalt-zinc-cadmium efflux system outer membrane protein